MGADNGSLTEERVELARRLAARRKAVLGATIPRRQPGEVVSLSPAQSRLWFLEQLRPGTNAWNTGIALRLRGALNAEALRYSLEFLVQRHESLRTVFPAPGGRPSPLVLEVPQFDLPLLDGCEEDVTAFVEGQLARPFDLERDLMLRGQLLRLSDDDHVLVLVAHHIACDGWSKGVLLAELGQIYDAALAGDAPALPALPIDYADYAAWQRDVLSGAALDRLISYWKARLADAPPALALPTDRTRPPRQAFSGAVVWLRVPAALAATLVRLGRQERATPFMTLLAAFNVFLFALSGQEDILVGSPSAMRTLPELDRVVGMFANTLVYRTSLAGAPTFAEVVRRVRETAVGVYAHQDLPFDQIVQAVSPARDPSRNPLVQVNMRVEGAEPELQLQDVTVERLEVDPRIARFDLAIELSADGDGYAGYLEYDTALYEPATAERFAANFAAILGRMAASPDSAIPTRFA
jgi:Condensation domain